MTELKTKHPNKNVSEFLNRVENPKRRDDSFKILKIMQEITQEEPIMWGDSIIGFGSYHYKYASGRETDWLQIGFSPRKQYLTIYIMDGVDNYEDLLKKLGKHKLGKSCLYINKLKDINIRVLKELMIESIKHIKKISSE